MLGDERPGRYRERMSPTASRSAVALALALGLGASACGATKPVAVTTSSEVKECRAQWHDVARSVDGLDQDTHPSALASRWESVIATVVLYENTTSAKNCQQNIETQIAAITGLRQFSARLQPYDMEYQAQQAAADVGRYLADPLPAPSAGKHGKSVEPPAKATVSAALDRLEAHAATADADIAPGWSQLASVELSDETAVTGAIQDLGYLAQDSAEWKLCHDALGIIATAVRARQG